MSLTPPDLIRFAYLSLKGNPVRSLLSTIGVFMGVFAISATLEARNISQAFLAQQLASREAPRATVFHKSWDPNADPWFELKPEDVTLLRQRLSGWQAIAPSNRRRGGKTVLFEGEDAPTAIKPVSIDYLDISGRELRSGRFFSSSDFEKYRAVAVIDEWLETELFPENIAVGKSIYIDNNSYLIIGVVNSREEWFGARTSGLVMISMAFEIANTGSNAIDEILIRPQNINDLETIKDQAVAILTQEKGQEFYAWTNVEDMDFFQNILRTVSIVLLVLGGIALTVGGVGIANITIASTIERTSEIGLRRAIGATQRDILVQFVLEAVVISCMGGMIAIATTQGIAFFVTQAFDLPHAVNLSTSAMALGAAVMVGVGSSLLPALQASRLDPVTALRA